MTQGFGESDKKRFREIVGRVKASKISDTISALRRLKVVLIAFPKRQHRRCRCYTSTGKFPQSKYLD